MELPVVDYKRKWYVLAAVGTGVFMSSLDGSIVNVALPTLAKSLHTTFAVVQWVVLAYMLVIATSMLTVGRLGDMFGKKRIYGFGFVIFTLGSVACGLSQSVEILILSRVVQAVGSVMMMALGPAIMTEAFPPNERGKALGFGGLMVSLGGISGPTIGGLIVGSLSWNWIFFINLPVGVIGTWLAFRYVHDLRPTTKSRFDFAGAGTLFVGMLCLLLALTVGQDAGFGNPVVLALFVGASLFLAAFLFIETRVAHPMVDLRMFSSRLFSINLITGFMVFVCSSGVVLLVPFYLQTVLKFGAQESGLLLATIPVALGIVAPLAGSLSDRFGSRRLTAIGLLVLFGGYLAVGTLDENTTALGYILRALPVGIGLGLFQSPNNSAIMGSVSRDRLGVASGFMALTRTTGQTVGVALLGSLWASSVLARAGGAAQTALEAAPGLQVAAFHDTVGLILVLIFTAFLLSLNALVEERRIKNGTVLRNPQGPAAGGSGG
jgi:EmrB/QacA subfamily drug resistance transporter